MGPQSTKLKTQKKKIMKQRSFYFLYAKRVKCNCCTNYPRSRMRSMHLQMCLPAMHTCLVPLYLSAFVQEKDRDRKSVKLRSTYTVPDIGKTQYGPTNTTIFRIQNEKEKTTNILLSVYAFMVITKEEIINFNPQKSHNPVLLTFNFPLVGRWMTSWPELAFWDYGGQLIAKSHWR